MVSAGTGRSQPGAGSAVRRAGKASDCSAPIKPAGQVFLPKWKPWDAGVRGCMLLCPALLAVVMFVFSLAQNGTTHPRGATA